MSLADFAVSCEGIIERVLLKFECIYHSLPRPFIITDKAFFLGATLEASFNKTAAKVATQRSTLISLD